jgi:uncharacterized membrane protein
MSEKQRLKLPVWLQEPFTEDENRVLNKAYALMTMSCLLGILLMFLGELLNLPFILRWLGLGLLLVGLLWGMVGVLPRMLKITKRARKRAQEK